MIRLSKKVLEISSNDQLILDTVIALCWLVVLAGLSEWRIFRVSIPQSRVSLDPEFRSIQNLPREILENRHFGDPVTRQPFRY
jgi:hypothetical protein